MTAEELETWVAQGIADGLLQNPSSVVALAERFLVESTIDVAGRAVGICISVPPDFPIKLPLIWLQEPEEWEHLPHIAAGTVCYADSEGMLLNRQRPDLVLTWSVEHTRNVLIAGISGDQAEEFTRELEVYWGKLEGSGVFNFLNPAANVVIATIYENGSQHLLAQNESEIPRWFRPKTGSPPIKGVATYFPLLVGTTLIPPRKEEPFWSIEQLRVLVAPTLAAMPPKRRRQLFKKDDCWRGTLMLGIPTAEGHYSLIGIDYTSAKGFHPLDVRGSDFVLRPAHIYRWERSYLIPRGGGKVDLTTKRVLLVGCGAIGGYLAYELVRAGIQKLTLVDPDTLTIHNMHRHALGKRGISKHKTDALRDDIQQSYLYAEVTSVAKTVQTALSEGKIRFEAFDLIIAATGEASLELYLNEQLHASQVSPPTIYTWLEPYGLGGHALLTWPHKPGCLQCLYTSEDSTASFANRALFAAPGQRFSVALSGCGSLHTPYASLDASQTATLAARLAVNALMGRETTSPLWSWKGDKREFKAAGFKVGPRYKLSEETLRREATLYVSAQCPICAH